MTEEYVAKLMGYGESGNYNVVEIVIHDYPLVAVVERFCVFIGQEDVDTTVFLDVDITLARDLEHVNGQAVNVVVDQTLPGSVSNVAVYFIIHKVRLHEIFVGVGLVLDLSPFFLRDPSDRVLMVRGGICGRIHRIPLPPVP